MLLLYLLDAPNVPTKCTTKGEIEHRTINNFIMIADFSINNIDILPSDFLHDGESAVVL